MISQETRKQLLAKSSKEQRRLKEDTYKQAAARLYGAGQVKLQGAAIGFALQRGPSQPTHTALGLCPLQKCLHQAAVERFWQLVIRINLSHKVSC